MRQHALRDQRAGIETDRAGGDEIASAKSQEIGGARPSAVEVVIDEIA